MVTKLGHEYSRWITYVLWSSGLEADDSTAAVAQLTHLAEYPTRRTFLDTASDFMHAVYRAS